MQQATILLDKLRTHGKKLVTAESCTGGLIASHITALAGASDVFDRGFVTYSNQAKTDMLGVNPQTLANFGAVSAEVAREMALGALKNSAAQIAVSTTGIAGPTGGSDNKPVGLVYIGVATYRHIGISRYADMSVKATKFHFSGNRKQIQAEAAERALELVLSQREVFSVYVELS